MTKLTTDRDLAATDGNKRPHRPAINDDTMVLVKQKMAAEGWVGSVTKYIEQIIRNYALSPVRLAYGRVYLDKGTSGSRRPGKRKPRDPHGS